jgi:hypothetical protein
MNLKIIKIEAPYKVHLGHDVKGSLFDVDGIMELLKMDEVFTLNINMPKK